MPDTNGQVSVYGNHLHINLYHRDNDTGFHPDMIAAIVRGLVTDDVVKQIILLGNIFADCHAWYIHHYSDSPIEQLADIQPALDRVNTHLKKSEEDDGDDAVASAPA